MSQIIKDLEDSMDNEDSRIKLYELLNSYSDKQIKDLQKYYEKQGYKVDEADLKNNLVILMESLAMDSLGI